MGTYVNYETLIRWYYLDWLAHSLKSLWRMFNNIFFQGLKRTFFFLKASVIRFRRKMIPNSRLLLCKNIFVLNPRIWSCKSFQFAIFHFRHHQQVRFSQTQCCQLLLTKNRQNGGSKIGSKTAPFLAKFSPFFDPLNPFYCIFMWQFF